MVKMMMIDMLACRGKAAATASAYGSGISDYVVAQCLSGRIHSSDTSLPTSCGRRVRLKEWLRRCMRRVRIYRVRYVVI